MSERQPLAGEGQVTINTPMWNVPHNHPRKMKHHTDRFWIMSHEIDKCIRRVIKDRPERTSIRYVDCEWIVNDSPEGLI